MELDMVRKNIAMKEQIIVQTISSSNQSMQQVNVEIDRLRKENTELKATLVELEKG